MFHSFFRTTRKQQPQDEIRLFSERDLAEQGSEGFTPADLAADNDLSYDDALLDLEMRTFFRHEYGPAEPHANVYGRVLHSINAAAVAAQPSLPSQVHTPGFLARVSTVLGRTLAGPTSARLMPGLVALMLVIAVLGPNTSRFVSGQADVIRTGAYATPAASSRASDFTRVKAGIAELASPEATEAPAPTQEIIINAAPDKVALDPYELGLPARARVTHTHTVDKENTDYVSTVGPQ